MRVMIELIGYEKSKKKALKIKTVDSFNYESILINVRHNTVFFLARWIFQFLKVLPYIFSIYLWASFVFVLMTI